MMLAGRKRSFSSSWSRRFSSSSRSRSSWADCRSRTAWAIIEAMIDSSRTSSSSEIALGESRSALEARR